MGLTQSIILIMTNCNAEIFIYKGDAAVLYLIIALDLLLMIFLLYKMCKLCSSAFSYSNFHIHEAYKFYTITIISVSLMALSRKTQSDYQNEQQLDPNEIVLQGYQIMNQIIGVLSSYASNMMYALVGFTWLLISLGCDFTLSPSGSASMIGSVNSTQSPFRNLTRRRILFFRSLAMYVILPALLCLSFIGTLKRSDGWCQIASLSVVVSTIFSLLLFMVAVIIFLVKRFPDPTTKRRTKAILIYLAVSMLVRQVYFIISEIGGSSLFLNEYLSLLEVIACRLTPIVGMSLLADLQLQNERCALLKSSEIMLFKSTII